MFLKRKRQINVQNSTISIKRVDGEDYMSLTDMIKNKDGDFFVADWLRNRNTLEFLSVWENMYNPDFNYGESAVIKSNAGLNNFKISVKDYSTPMKQICSMLHYLDGQLKDGEMPILSGRKRGRTSETAQVSMS